MTVAETSAPLRLHVQSCKEDPSRYCWFIQEREHIVRQSCYSLPDEHEALAQGCQALQEAAAIWRDSH
ncbi:hypothetical protein [Methylobacterium nigriterrae]|uniref:hypothetical protein n=1 Tax=Methylobacterium nigriterrae TaxID=3127512 RepID=UPI003013FFFE